MIALIITAVTLPGWFALGAYLTVLVQIIRPVNAVQVQRDAEARTLLFAERLRLNGASYPTIQALLPKNDIPTTIRKSYF